MSIEKELLVELMLDLKKDVSEIKRDLADTKEMTTSNKAVLEEHARRSTASEVRLDVQEEKLEQFIEDMEPVQEHIRAVSTLTKFIVKGSKVVTNVLKAGAAILAIIGAVKEFLKFH